MILGSVTMEIESLEIFKGLLCISVAFLIGSTLMTVALLKIRNELRRKD